MSSFPCPNRTGAPGTTPGNHHDGEPPSRESTRSLPAPSAGTEVSGRRDRDRPLSITTAALWAPPGRDPGDGPCEARSGVGPSRTRFPRPVWPGDYQLSGRLRVMSSPALRSSVSLSPHPPDGSRPGRPPACQPERLAVCCRRGSAPGWPPGSFGVRLKIQPNALPFVDS